jgi:hypothetical protein
MKLSQLLNTLLDRGFEPQLYRNGDVVCSINLDDGSFGFTIAPSDAFVRCLCWSTYAGQAYFDRCFQTLNQAIFAAQMTAIFDDARLTEAIVGVTGQ